MSQAEIQIFGHHLSRRSKICTVGMNHTRRKVHVRAATSRFVFDKIASLLVCALLFSHEMIYLL